MALSWDAKMISMLSWISITKSRVLEIDQSNRVLTVARDDLFEQPVPEDQFLNSTMDNNSLFDGTMCIKNISILYCHGPDPSPHIF